jgi:hypothetical protein
VEKCVFTHVSALNTGLIRHPTRLKQATHILSTPELPCESGPVLNTLQNEYQWNAVLSCLIIPTNVTTSLSPDAIWPTCHAPFYVIMSTVIMTIVIHVSTMSGCLGTKLISFRTLLRHKIHECGSNKSGFSWTITIFCG